MLGVSYYLSGYHVKINVIINSILLVYRNKVVMTLKIRVLPLHFEKIASSGSTIMFFLLKCYCR